MIWTSTLQIWRLRYPGDFSFIILFVVDILSLYAINLDIVSLFADLPVSAPIPPHFLIIVKTHENRVENILATLQIT
jgi:hypothetical protein